MVNFTTTSAGLTGQLLDVALQNDKPELEQRKSELLRAEEESKIEIGKLEDSLLEQLAGSTGNILDNRELLDSLNETKRKSGVIASSLKESLELQDSLDKEGSAYLPLAKFASQVYFAIADLAKLNHMYRLSLSAFVGLYKKTLQATTSSKETIAKRVDTVKQVRLFRCVSIAHSVLFEFVVGEIRIESTIIAKRNT